MHTNIHTYTLPADMTTSAAAPSLMDDELHTCTCIACTSRVIQAVTMYVYSALALAT